jgi:hypothetical protein
MCDRQLRAPPEIREDAIAAEYLNQTIVNIQGERK